MFINIVCIFLLCLDIDDFPLTFLLKYNYYLILVLVLLLLLLLIWLVLLLLLLGEVDLDTEVDGIYNVGLSDAVILQNFKNFFLLE